MDMSRYDQPSEPDFDRYEDKPIDVQDEPQDGEPWGAAVDPAEHAAHALIDALATMERQLAQVTDVQRAIVLKAMLDRAWRSIDRLALAATDKITECVERRR